MDLNGDGILDLISGQYQPGVVSFFKGTAQGFEEPERIKEEVPAPADKSDRRSSMRRVMACANFVDWDADGDMDMVVGNVSGQVFVNINKGSKTNPQFGDRKPVLVQGAAMKVSQKSDPWPVDWDGDGNLDLLVGCEAGDVTFFRGRPDRTFEQGVSLFSGHKLTKASYSEVKKTLGQDRVMPGYRLRVGTADWNNDGKQDLLVGNCEKGEDGKTVGFVYVMLRK